MDGKNQLLNDMDFELLEEISPRIGSLKQRITKEELRETASKLLDELIRHRKTWRSIETGMFRAHYAINGPDKVLTLEFTGLNTDHFIRNTKAPDDVYYHADWCQLHKCNCEANG